MVGYSFDIFGFTIWILKLLSLVLNRCIHDKGHVLVNWTDYYLVFVNRNTIDEVGKALRHAILVARHTRLVHWAIVVLFLGNDANELKLVVLMLKFVNIGIIIIL